MADPRYIRDPSRFDKLDYELVDALLACKVPKEEIIDDAKVAAAVLKKLRSQVALACEHILTQGLTATKRDNTYNAELVCTVARITQYDSIVDLLYRYVKIHVPESYADYIHVSVNRLLMESSQRLADRKQARTTGAAEKQPPKTPRKKKK